MEILKTTKGKANIELSIDELLTLNNALNEVCNGISLPEFKTRMGVSPEEVRMLLNLVGKLIDELESSDS